METTGQTANQLSYQRNKAKIQAYNKKNKEIIAQKKKAWYEANKEKAIADQKAWRLANKEHINKTRVQKHKDKPLFKLSVNIRNLVGNSFRSKGFKKASKTSLILGCDYDTFIKHIMDQFEPWMTLENHGKYNGEFNWGWDIDHIIPLSSAVNEEDVIRLNHYTNLRPLCSKVNRDLKRGKH